jgi:uncharacterized spore protein YtfJ
MQSRPVFKVSHGAPAGRAITTLSSLTEFGGSAAAGASWAPCAKAVVPAIIQANASAPLQAQTKEILADKNAVIASAPAQ